MLLMMLILVMTMSMVTVIATTLMADVDGINTNAPTLLSGTRMGLIDSRVSDKGIYRYAHTVYIHIDIYTRLAYALILQACSIGGSCVSFLRLEGTLVTFERASGRL